MSILRLPLVTGHTWTGAQQIANTPARVISSVVQLAEAPSDVSLDCVPVDVAAHLIAWVALSANARGVDAMSGKFVDKDPLTCVTHVCTTIGKLHARKIVEALWLAGYRHISWADRGDWLAKAAKNGGRLSPAQRPDHIAGAQPLVNSLTAPEISRTYGRESEPKDVEEITVGTLKHMILYLQRQNAIPTAATYMGKISEERDPEEFARGKKDEEVAFRGGAVKAAMLHHQARGGKLFCEVAPGSSIGSPARSPGGSPRSSQAALQNPMVSGKGKGKGLTRSVFTARAA